MFLTTAPIELKRIFKNGTGILVDQKRARDGKRLATMNSFPNCLKI